MHDPSRHIVERHEQRLDVYLGEGEQLAAETSLVCQCPVDVKDAGTCESLLASHPISQSQHLTPIPLLGVIVQRPLAVRVRSRERQTQDHCRNHREHTQADPRTRVTSPPSGLFD